MDVATLAGMVLSRTLVRSVPHQIPVSYTHLDVYKRQSQDIRIMSEDALLDMDYFLNDDELDDGFGEEGFYIF